MSEKSITFALIFTHTPPLLIDLQGIVTIFRMKTQGYLRTEISPILYEFR